MGTQEIYRAGGHDPNTLYLRYNHKNPYKRCHIGRVRSTAEAMSDFNTPDSTPEYKKALDSIVKDIRNLVGEYPPESRIWQKVLLRRLNDIFHKYGY